jgi:hypothetical protein
MAFNQDLPIIMAASTSRLQAEAMSTPERIGAFTAGATISGLYSIYNSVASGVNFFGGDLEKADTASTLRTIDENWGGYYQQNKEAIDTVGFIAASLIPSTLAVKGLNMLRYGEAVGPIGRTLGYTATKQSGYLNAAIKELAQDGGTIYSKLNRNFLNSIAWGAADNTLQSAAATIATAATMHASPMFDGKDLGDIAWEVARDTMLGGGIGGAIEGLFAKGIYKGAVGVVDKKLREVDRYGFEAARDLSFGDKAVDALSHLEKISPEALKNIDRKVSYGWSLNGQKFSTELDLSRIMDSKVRSITTKALHDFELSIRNGAGNELAGDALANSFLNLRRQADDLGLSEHEVNSKLGGVLMGLKSAKPLGEESASLYKGERMLFMDTQFESVRTFDSKEEAFKSYKLDPKAGNMQALRTAAAEDGYDGLIVRGETKKAGFVDTRGQLKRFHGTGGALDPSMLRDDLQGSLDNIYGRGFYTTDAAEVGAAYGKKAGKDAKLFELKHSRDVKLFDLEQPAMSSEYVEAFKDLQRGAEDLLGKAIPLKTEATLTDVLDAVRNEWYTAKLPLASYQALMTDLTSKLAVDGFEGFRHVGGKFVGKIQHDVHIYWTPKASGLSIELVDPGTFKTAAEFGPVGAWKSNAKLADMVGDEGVIPTTYFNTETGATSFRAISHIGDMQSIKNPVEVVGNNVLVGRSVYSFNPAELFSLEEPVSIHTVTARHLWSDTLRPRLIPKKIAAEDVSLLDRIREIPGDVDKSTEILLTGTTRSITVGEIMSSGGYSNFLRNHKADLLKDYVERFNSPDVQELAYRLNATQAWVEATIANDFKAAEVGFSRPLRSYRNPENLALQYENTAGYKPDFLDALVDHKQRLKVAEEKLTTAAKTVLGDLDGLLIAPDSDFAKIASASRTGSGSSLAGASNAGYENKLGSFVQYVGVQAAKIMDERANTTALQLQGPLTKILQNPSKAAELAAISTAARATDEKLVMMGVEQGFPGNYLVSRKMAKLADEDIEAFTDWKERAIAGLQGKEQIFKIADEDVADFMKQWINTNDRRMEQRGVLANAHGMTHQHEAGTFYVPPIDTTKQPFFAFVKAKDGAIFGRTDVGVLTARTEEELIKLSDHVKTEGFDVWFKKDTEQFFKAKGEYEYGRTLHESGINSELKKRGVLFEFMPNMNPESVVSEYLNYTRRAEHGLVRDAISTKYHALTAELSSLSENYTSVATSKTGWLSKIAARAVDDPYGDYMRTMLNVSKRAEYPILQQTNDFIDAVGTRAYRAINAGYQEMKSGKISWEEAGPLLRRYGLGESFKDESLFQAAQTTPDKNLIREYINRANALIATTTLRLDFLNPIVNVLSTPVMAFAEIQSLKKLVSKDPELSKLFEDLTTVKLPDGSMRVGQSSGKLLAKATENYWKQPERIELYRSIGAIDGTMNLHRKMIDDLGMGAGVESSKLSKIIEGAAAKGEAITGNKFAEQFTRFVSADMMFQMTEGAVKKGLMSEPERNSFINIFVNRVQGNYLASQRPILFQGTTGAAIGMFQTYTFNMLQQLFRHVENRDAAAMATMLGMQTSIYGLNGLPGFDAINTHIIGNGKLNSHHADLYTKSAEIFGKESGEWLMYGSASAMPFFSAQSPALYTRGDINPRYLTIVPTNPKDVPAFSAGIKVVDLISNMADGIAGDGSVKSTFLQGLEHNGLSRPLAGLGAVLQGGSTTGKGNLIAANNDLLSIATLSRLAGAKPMDESIARNEQFRQLAYKANDRAKLEKLAYHFKTKIINGEEIDAETQTEMLAKYAASGGRIENYGMAIKSWMKDATTSQISQIMQNHRNPYAQRMIEIMGGEAPGDTVE